MISTMNGMATATQARLAKRVYSAITTAPTIHEPITTLTPLSTLKGDSEFAALSADSARKASQPPAWPTLRSIEYSPTATSTTTEGTLTHSSALTPKYVVAVKSRPASSATT